MELYTGGAYTTGDLDFVGELNERVEGELEAAGFQRQGRHWIRREGEVFLELPSRSLEKGAELVLFRSGSLEIRLLSPEDVLVDRLAAWWFWRSPSDGGTACKLFWQRRGELEIERLRKKAEARDVARALALLLELLENRDELPDEDELADWAKRCLE